MTDEQLRSYLGLDGESRGIEIVAGLTPEKRATYERMHAVEVELNLWQAGLVPKPPDVIVCQPKRRQ